MTINDPGPNWNGMNSNDTTSTEWKLIVCYGVCMFVCIKSNVNFVQVDTKYTTSNQMIKCVQVDTKYTTSNQMIKLTGSHSISKITLRIGDLKRQKMVRTINIYYNNR